MTQVIFSFDTEDYTAAESDDAILELAGILRAEGVRGCFNIVGRLAEALVDRRRGDVIEALAYHEIDYHSLAHTLHPVIAEYCDTEEWEEGRRRFIAEESEGIAIVKSVFERDRLWAAVPPGRSIAAQAIYGYAELGIPIYAGSLFRETRGRGIWFCNALNLEYNGHADDLLLEEGIARARDLLDEWRRMDRLILCCHPNIIVFEEFWDFVNYRGSNLVPWGAWQKPSRRSPEAMERFYHDFRTLVRMLRDDPGFSLTTYESVYKELGADEIKPRQYTQEEVRAQLSAIDKRFASPGSNKDRTGAISLARLFWATVDVFSGSSTSRTERGFLHEPQGIAKPMLVSCGAIEKAARRLAKHAVGSTTDWLPESIDIGDVSIGPRDFLEAAAQILTGSETARILPRPQMPDMAGFYGFNDLQLRKKWMFSDEFQDHWVTKRLRLQSWTIRPSDS